MNTERKPMQDKIAGDAGRTDARQDQTAQSQPGVAPYRPLAPDALYLGPEEWAERTAAAVVARLTPFASASRSARGIHCTSRSPATSGVAVLRMDSSAKYRLRYASKTSSDT